MTDIISGAVIIPAHNEEHVIGHLLAELSRVSDRCEIVVACNGCTDRTVEIARSFSGVRVLQLEQSSKTDALNGGDAAATAWPRLYIDADVVISAESVLAVLDRLSRGDVLAASAYPVHDSSSSSLVVRSFYRAKTRIFDRQPSLNQAGAYGLTEAGHGRFGNFPRVINDDQFVETRFSPAEKTVVGTAPSIVRAPATTRSLLGILQRHKKGQAEHISHVGVPDTAITTVRTVLDTVHDWRSAVDAGTYLFMVSVARIKNTRTRNQRSSHWARDETSRLRPR
jgi:glycosyltransferase involved in cell wall biosynthesis